MTSQKQTDGEIFESVNRVARRLIKKLLPGVMTESWNYDIQFVLKVKNDRASLDEKQKSKLYLKVLVGDAKETPG